MLELWLLVLALERTASGDCPYKTSCRLFTDLVDKQLSRTSQWICSSICLKIVFSSTVDFPFHIAVIDQLPNLFADFLTQSSSQLTGVYDRLWLPYYELPVASSLAATPMTDAHFALPHCFAHAAHSSLRTALSMPSPPQSTTQAMLDPASS